MLTSRLLELNDRRKELVKALEDNAEDMWQEAQRLADVHGGCYSGLPDRASSSFRIDPLPDGTDCSVGVVVSADPVG